MNTDAWQTFTAGPRQNTYLKSLKCLQPQRKRFPYNLQGAVSPASQASLPSCRRVPSPRSTSNPRATGTQRGPGRWGVMGLLPEGHMGYTWPNGSRIWELGEYTCARA